MVILNKNADIAQLKTKIKKFSVVPLSFAELLSRPELLAREFGWQISAHPTEPRFRVVVDGKSIDVDGECGYILVGLYKPDIDIAWGSTEEELKIFADMHALKLTNSLAFDIISLSTKQRQRRKQMSKFTPTTKPTYEIRMLIDPDPFSKCYVSHVSDPIDTHAIYNVDKDKVDDFKERIKKIGGKYIRVVSSAMQNRKIICFALEITPEEETKVKMEELKKARFQAAFDSKLAEVKDNILLREAGATNEIALKKFARYLLDGTLDSIVPLESYVFIDDPTDKDEQRIYDIIRKANDGCAGCVGMVTNNIIKMVSLAEDMNKKITKEDKRLRRRAACMKYGLNFLAKCFESSAA